MIRNIERQQRGTKELPNALETVKKGVEGSKKAIKGIVEFIKTLDKKHLAPLVAPFAKLLNFFKLPRQEFKGASAEATKERMRKVTETSLNQLRSEIEQQEEAENIYYNQNDLPSALERTAAIKAAGKFDEFREAYIKASPSNAVLWEVDWMIKNRIPRATEHDITKEMDSRMAEQSEKVKERFDKLEQEKGAEVAFYAKRVFTNYLKPLTSKKRYGARALLQDFGSNKRKTMTNSCVGFVMSTFSRLPFKIPSGAKAGKNAARYLNNYDWSKDKFTPKERKGKDGHRYIEDIWGKQLPKETTIENPDPKTLDQHEAFKHLAVGEYAIASLSMHHVFLIYKDLDNAIKMVHSGRDLDGKGKYTGSRVNETTLAHYIEHTPKAQGKSVTFVPLSEMVEIANQTKNTLVASYYQNQGRKA